MNAHRMNLPSRARTVIVAVMTMLTLGIAGRASAQDFTDYRDCMTPGTSWALCTPKFNMPIGMPEVSLSPSSSAPGWIVYNPATQAMTVDGSAAFIVYFNNLGNSANISGGALAIRLKMTTDGRFIGGGGGACGIGSSDDFCVTGTVYDAAAGKLYGGSGSLLRGKIAHVGFKKNAIVHSGAPFDDFEFHVNLTGGDLYLNKILPEQGITELAVEVFGYNDGVSYTGDSPFSSPGGFAQTYVMAFSGPTSTAGIVFDDKCDGRISGYVVDIFNPFGGVPGAEVQLTGSENLVPGTYGAYSGTNLCVGTYQVAVLPPAGWLVYGPGSATVTVSKLADGHNSVTSGINFWLYSSPIDTSAFTTFTQAAWGTKPRGNNAGNLLKMFFNLVYPEEVVVGVQGVVGRYSITLTGAQAVQDFLPQNGRAVPLDRSYVDPASMWKLKHKGKFGNHRKISELGGEVVALELNVRFSVYSITRSGFGSLHLASGLLMGKTVNEVLAIGNSVLGGNPLPAGFKKYEELEEILDKINRNYEAGAPSKGYLKP